jgi:hypothetical protein
MTGLDRCEYLASSPLPLYTRYSLDRGLVGSKNKRVEIYGKKW